HGRVAVALLSIAGVFLGLYQIVPPILKQDPLPAPLVHGALLISSLLIAAIAFTRWKTRS
ncbi:hypothetical protein N9Z02_01250, partial [Akkermansiaceae bacterium]|nr:hypothetical protein [Akkermansiaceae bacterium]